MHRALSSRTLGRALNISERCASFDIPLFLCPAIGRTTSGAKLPAASRISSDAAQPSWRIQKRCLHVEAQLGTTTESPENETASLPRDIRGLPLQCPGCGALTQSNVPDLAGYYDLDRRSVREYMGLDQPKPRRERAEDRVYAKTLDAANLEELERKGVDVRSLFPGIADPPPETSGRNSEERKAPLCERCHKLVHYSSGVPIHHPTIDSIKDTLEESPYKYNHVYHVLDAADFPMSILPQIHKLLDLMPLRSKNRRARHGRFYGGQKTEMSFIITRADLLAPTLPLVNRLVPYLKRVLRDALGRTGRDVRLGNVKCVSAKRSWWTKELKEEIWQRGGAGWMVGKVNVGKSQLFESVFPKGRMDWDVSSTPNVTVRTFPKPEDPEALIDPGEKKILEAEYSDEFSLLPPARPEEQYPAMPTVSSLPGTTASPIRIPFGKGRGELIDLPGFARSDLENHVQEEHRSSLVMRSRIVPEQHTLKPGRSLLIGGFIRITPRNPDLVFLSYAFTPIKAHLTSTEKAIAIQEETGDINVENIALPGTGKKIKHAGSFELKWDVTKQRAGPITAPDAVDMRVDRLPYRVLATDILIEGVGWVEVVAQVRVKDLYRPKTQAADEGIQPTTENSEVEEDTEKLSGWDKFEAALGDDARMSKKQAPKKKVDPKPVEPECDSEHNWPVIDVFSPEGKFIGARAPMNGWVLNKPKRTAQSMKSRPRKSMKNAKKMEKRRKRGDGPALRSFTSQSI